MQENSVNGTVKDGSSEITDSIWCEECGVCNIGECCIHGGDITITHDNSPPSKACLSLPKVLTFKRAKDINLFSNEAKKGVFAKKLIKSRTLFGPVEGVLTNSRPALPSGSLVFQVSSVGGACRYLDLSDENKCNWMMFVRPASLFSHQNMAAFENNKQIFFVTCKNIEPGGELRVWYSAAYAKAIGKQILYPKEPINKDKVVKPATNRNGEIEAAGQSSPGQSPTYQLTSPEKNVCLTQQDEGLSKFGCPQASELKPYTCDVCMTSFARLRQLDSHICRDAIDEEESLDGLDRRLLQARGANTAWTVRTQRGTSLHLARKRKGKPSKITEQFISPVKVVKIPQEFVESDLHGLNVPCDDIIHDMRDIQSSTELSSLPALDQVMPGNGTAVQASPRRGPGRPKGSKNKEHVAKVPKETFKCRFCDRTLCSQEQQLVHESIHTNTQPYKCTYDGCSKTFASKFKFQRHMVVHEKPNNIKCKLCPRTFNRIDHLKNHLSVHDSNREAYTCTVCGKSYLYKSTLTFHLAKHEANEGDSLTCLICKASFLSKDELKKHVNSHNRYKPEPCKSPKQTCSECGKHFATLKDVRRHKITHTKERPFLCEHCPQTFVRRDHLRRHYTTNHRKEMYESQKKVCAFSCGACLMVFKKQEFLDYHNKTVHPDGVPVAEPGKTAPANTKAKKVLPGSAKPAAGPLVNRLIQQKPSPTALLVKQEQALLPAIPPVSIVKVQRPIQPNIQPNIQTMTPILFPGNLQPISSAQSMLYDTEDVIYSTVPIKTFPIQNQLLTSAQVQAHLQQQHTQQQAQQFLKQQQLLQNPGQPVLQDQGQTPVQIQHFQQFALQQQLVQPVNQLVQPVNQLFQTIPVSDLLNSLASLGQVDQTLASTNIVIAVDGQNLVNLQGLNKPLQWTLVKDSSKQAYQPLESKTADSCLLSCQPEPCYSTESNSTVLQVLTQPPKPTDMTCVSAGDAPPSVMGLTGTIIQMDEKDLAQNDGNTIMGQQLQDQSQQSQLQQSQLQQTQLQQSQLQQSQLQQSQLQQSQLQQSQLQQSQLQQSQLHAQLQEKVEQELPSFTLSWADNFDFPHVTEMTSDVTSAVQEDGANTGTAGWILQIPPAVLENQTQAGLSDR